MERIPREILERPVRVLPSNVGPAGTFGAALGTETTLLVFLRHLG